MARCIVRLCFLLASFFTGATAADGLSADECLGLGFRRPDLTCATCRRLSAFRLDDLEGDCEKCCTRTEDRDATKKYSRAVLEVCACKFGYLPQIEAFVKSSRPDQFPNLSIKYLRGADPVIKLVDDGGEVQEELNIKKWDTDTIEEFLREHLS